MASPGELRTFLDHKFVLFDTNIYIEAFKHFESFEVLLNTFRQANCKTVYFPLIEFEFTRDAFKLENNQARQEFLTALSGIRLPLDADILNKALDIARVYAYGKIKPEQISVVDCCIAAYLCRYASSVLLVTLNHRDFPLSIFDRIYCFAVDAGETVLAPAIYKFNEEKWAAAWLRYQKGLINAQESKK